MNAMQSRIFTQPITDPQGFSRRIGRLAVRALYTELSLYPKPGLVSPLDNGSHSDMSMATFMRSLFSLRTYFPEIAVAGGAGHGFAALQRLGIEAECRMLAATGGVNTHRGAIFNLGLLSAAAGYHSATQKPMHASDICLSVAALWGGDILSGHKPDSNGARAVAAHGGGGAREQAASAYPVLRELALPTFQNTFRLTGDRTLAALQTIFSIMSSLNDTNILHRAGPDGLDFARREADEFLLSGGVFSDDHIARAITIHRAFCAKRISPGGAADLLACTVFLHDLEIMH